MNILITNSCLESLGGSQSFVRDLGLGLQNLGHTVMAYSSDPGDREVLCQNGMVPTTDQLEKLPFRPDVIHGQHHLDAMAAIIALPGVPAIYHCHGAVWRECPPRHPRIYHYLAMSRTLAERIMVESNIAPAEITVWLNSVELGRFANVRTLPLRPARALLYNKMHGLDSPTTTAITEAASRLGIVLEFAGRKFDRLISDPQNFLPNYDIVFASGKSAIDALACGCAVIVLGRTSCGEMVVPENFDRLRQANFAIAVNSPPPSADKIERELRRYSAEPCTFVSQRVRHEADASLSAEKLVSIYEQVIARHQSTQPDLPAEMLATAQYLRKITPLVQICDDAWTTRPMNP